MHFARGRAVTRHGVGVAAAQAQHVVGRQGQAGGALQFEDLHLLDRMHGLVCGQRCEVECGARLQDQRVHTGATIDVAGARGQGALQIDACCNGNKVVAGHGVDGAAAVADRGCTGAVGAVRVAGVAARHQGAVSGCRLRKRNIVQGKIAAVAPALRTQLEINRPGGGGRVIDGDRAGTLVARGHGLSAVDQGMDEGGLCWAVHANFRVPVVKFELVTLALDHIDFGTPNGAQLPDAAIVVHAAVENLAAGQFEEGVVTVVSFSNGYARRIDFLRPGVGAAIPCKIGRLRQGCKRRLRVAIGVIGNGLVQNGKALALTHIVEAVGAWRQQGQGGGKTGGVTRIKVAIKATTGAGRHVPQIRQDALVAMHIHLLGRK